MAEFKKAPQYADDGGGPFDGGLYPFSVESMDYVMAMYWPALVGLAFAFALAVIGKQDKSLYAVGMAAILQGAVLAAQQ
ncbi:MAG TPA: hypothetical protein VLA52_12315 [Thermohalobaculum sp.]|nr:hypothetical protein [Thermohalobaculum sp.]